MSPRCRASRNSASISARTALLYTAAHVPALPAVPRSGRHPGAGQAPTRRPSCGRLVAVGPTRYNRPMIQSVHPGEVEDAAASADVAQLAALIAQAPRLVVLTGAGCSTESGI